MESPMSRRFVVVVVATLAASCAPPSVTIGQAASVTVTADPLSVAVDDESGRALLRLQGVAAASDLFDEVTQILPGWDGYREGVKTWKPVTKAEIVEADAEHAVVKLGGDVTGTLAVRADGDRVVFSFALDPVLAQTTT